jgi:DNA-binding NarL/FixJ family response regulator
MSPKTKVLVIEDEVSLRQNLVSVLELNGFQVAAAENGLAGIDLAKADPPDLILCDVTMPECDGHGVLKRLRQNPRTARVPFIFLTAKGERADVRAGMNLGADDYLHKPVSEQDLLEAIDARLEKHRVQRSIPADAAIDFSSAAPLQSLGLTVREAEVLLWVAQGKGNADIAAILKMSEGTVKKHLVHIFEKLGVESRSAAALRAIETLGNRAPGRL